MACFYSVCYSSGPWPDFSNGGCRVSVLVRGVHVQEPPFMQGSINHAKKCRVTNSKCMLTPTNSKITVASHVCSHHDMGGQHANPGIDEMGVQYVYI